MKAEDIERLRLISQLPWWDWKHCCGQRWWRPVRFIKALRSTRAAIRATLVREASDYFDGDRDEYVPKAVIDPVCSSRVITTTWGGAVLTP